MRLVRTNSLTSVKDLIKSFAAENKKRTVQTGMKSYFSAVTKAVGEVTGLSVSNSTTPTSITPLISNNISSSSTTSSTSSGSLPNISIATTGDGEVFHDMSDTAATTTMTEQAPKMDTNESKEGRDAKRQLSVSPITSPPKNKHKKTSEAAKSAAGSEDELDDKTKQLLLAKIKSLENELKNIKMGMIQHAEAQLRTTKDLEIIENAHRETAIRLEELGATAIEAKKASQDTAKKVEQLAKEFNSKLDSQMKQLHGKMDEAEAYAADNRATMAIIEKALKETRAGDNLQGPSRSAMGVYLSGVDKLREIISERHDEDPVAVVKRMLRDSRCFYFYDRIMISDRQNRMEAKTAMIYFRSLQNKKEAEVSIKRFLAHHQAKGVMIRDIFPSERMAEVGGLNKYGFDLKNEGTIDRFRIQNRRDVPILQGIYPGKTYYEDINLSGYSDAMELDNQDNNGGGGGEGEAPPLIPIPSSEGGAVLQTREAPASNNMIPDNDYSSKGAPPASLSTATAMNGTKPVQGGERGKSTNPPPNRGNRSLRGYGGGGLTNGGGQQEARGGGGGTRGYRGGGGGSRTSNDNHYTTQGPRQRGNRTQNNRYGANPKGSNILDNFSNYSDNSNDYYDSEYPLYDGPFTNVRGRKNNQAGFKRPGYV